MIARAALRRGPRSVRAGVAALLAVVAAAPVAAQTPDGPVVITRRERLEGLQITDLDMALEAYWRRLVDEVENGETTRDREDRFEETFEIHARGYAGHPNLVELDLLGRFGLQQEFIDLESNPNLGDTDERKIEYDLSALLLREGRLPVTVYARREERTFDRQFAGSFDNVVSENGVRLRYRSDVMPTSLVYYHREQEQTDQTGFNDLDLTQDTLELLSQLNLGPDHRLDVDYTYDHVDESSGVRVDRTFDRHDAVLTDTINFGDDREHQQRAELRYFEETGPFAFERLRFDESLTLRHTRDFRTRYDYTVDHQDRAESTQTFQIGRVGFTHELFESLVTNGEVGASHLRIDQDDFESEQRFGRLSSDYTKLVPGGRLSAGAAVNATWQRDDERGAEIQIRDEPRAFGVSGLIVLNRRNVIASSLVVTDASGLIVYDENIDYRVRAFTERIEIRRIVTGDILEGQTLLLDYRIGPEPGSTARTLGYSGRVRYDFEEGPLRGLAFRLEYREQNEDRDTERPDLLPANDFTDLIYGVEYRRGPWTFEAEQERRDSTVSPFEATRVEGSFVQSLGRGSTLLFAVDYNELEFTDRSETAQILTLTGRWRQRITDTLSARAELVFRDEDVSDGSDVQGFEQRLDLDWAYRQTTVYASIRNAILDSDLSTTTTQTFVVGFRREF